MTEEATSETKFFKEDEVEEALSRLLDFLKYDLEIREYKDVKLILSEAENQIDKERQDILRQNLSKPEKKDLDYIK